MKIMQFPCVNLMAENTWKIGSSRECIHDIVPTTAAGRIVSILLAIIGILFTGLVVAVAVRALQQAWTDLHGADRNAATLRLDRGAFMSRSGSGALGIAIPGSFI